MSVLPATIATVKEQEETYAPLLLAEFTFQDGSVFRASSRSLNTGEGGFQYNGHDYLGVIEKEDVAQVANTQGASMVLPPTVTLHMLDATRYILFNWEMTAGKGFRGAQVILRLIMWDAGTANYSTDSQIVFAGTCGAPAVTDTNLNVTARTQPMARIALPTPLVQARCPWSFPTTKAQRVGGATDASHECYECGYSPDVTDSDVSGGTAAARGNYVSGTTPYTDCDFTFASCLARLGNSALATSANPGPIEVDKSGRRTGRFGGVRWTPPTSWSGREYLTGNDAQGQNNSIDSKYNKPIPMVFGTTWVDCIPLQSLGDPNSTRGEAIVALGKLSGIDVLLCNDVRLDQANSQTFQAYSVPDALLRWNWISDGSRNGNVNRDAIFDGNGDCYGSMTAVEWCALKRVQDSSSEPHIRARVRGGVIPIPNDSNPAHSNSWPQAYTENPVWQVLELLTWGQVRYSDVDLQTFIDAAAQCSPNITSVGISGSSSSHARFRSSFVLTSRTQADDIIDQLLRSFGGIRFINPTTGLLQLFVSSTAGVQQPSAITGSNYATAITSKNWDGTSKNGYSAYDFDESNVIEDSMQRLEQGLEQAPNRLNMKVIDSDRDYVESQYACLDTDDVNQVGQEVAETFDVIGLMSFDQGHRVGATWLARRLRGNPQANTAGTWRIQFQSGGARCSHLRVGNLVRLSWQNWNISHQWFRIEGIQASSDFETVTLDCTWHSDDWYLDTYGQTADETLSGSKHHTLDRPPYAWLPGLQAPVAGDVVHDATEYTFDLNVDYDQQKDGTYLSRLLITGQLPVNTFATFPPPQTLAQGTTSPTGGNIHGGRIIYVAICSKDGTGKLTTPSAPITAIEVPIGTNTNKVTIPVIAWAAASSGYSLFAGEDPNHLCWQFDGSGTPSSIDVPGPLSVATWGLPDIEFDRLSVQVKRVRASGVATGTLASVGTGTLQVTGAAWTTNQWAGYKVSVIGKYDSSQNVPVADFTIASNTADTLTVTPDPNALGIQTSDYIVIRIKPTVGSDGTGNYVSDAKLALTVNAEKGNLLRIIAGTGAGRSYRIDSNTATKVYINGAWITTPDSTSIFIIEEPAWQQSKTVGPFDNAFPASQTTISLDTPNFNGVTVLVMVEAIDGGGFTAIERTSPVREVYIYGNPGSGAGAATVGDTVSVALTPSGSWPSGWSANPNYRTGPDGITQYVDASLRITPANDAATAGWDISIDTGDGKLLPAGFYPYQAVLPAAQDVVVSFQRPSGAVSPTWKWVAGTRGNNGAFNPPNPSRSASYVTATVTGYTSIAQLAAQPSGFSVSVIVNSTNPNAAHFKMFFTPPSDAQFSAARIDMAFCDDPATHGGAYVLAAGQTYFPVVDAPGTPGGGSTVSEQKSDWALGTVGSYILARARSVNLAGFVNNTSPATYGFLLSPSGQNPPPDNQDATAVTGFTCTVIYATGTPVAQAHFKFAFNTLTAPAVAVNIDMVFADNPASHGGAYVQSAGEQYFRVVTGAKTSPNEQKNDWPLSGVQGWVIARATPLNHAGVENPSGAATANQTILPAAGGAIPDNIAPGNVTGFSVSIIDDSSSPVPQSHFKTFFTPPAGDVNFAWMLLEMIFCDNPASHGGSYVPSAGAAYFTVQDCLNSPAEQTGWWPRGSVQGWLTARARSVNWLQVKNASGPTYNFTITASTGARLQHVDASTMGAGVKISGGQFQTDIGQGIRTVGNSMVLDKGANLRFNGNSVEVDNLVGVSHTINQSGITATFNPVSANGQIAGLTIDSNSTAAVSHIGLTQVDFANSSGIYVAVLGDGGSSLGGSLSLNTPSGGSGIIMSGGTTGSNASIRCFGTINAVGGLAVNSTSVITASLNIQNVVNVDASGTIDGAGGFLINGMVIFGSNSAFHPRQISNQTSLANAAAQMVNGELALYFDTTASKQRIAFKNNLGGAVSVDLT